MIQLFWVGKDNKNEDDDYFDSDYNDSEVNYNDWESKKEIKEAWQVALDIIEKSDEINIIAPIAWVDLDDINISIQANVLTISWERIKPSYLYSKWFIIRNSECFWGVFSRDIILPENMDFDSIKATLERNILVISIQKLKLFNQSIRIEKLDF